MALLAAALVSFAPSPAAPQSTQVTDTLAEARRLRDAGSLPAATRLLGAYTAAHPSDPVAAGLLGETHYWMKDVAGARAAYERGLAATPADIPLTLAYARMLMETSDHSRARQLLEPLRRAAATAGRAEEMLGTLAYWEGDYGAAKRLFAEALALDPRRGDARRSLREILTVTAPWVRLGGEIQHDDQPLVRIAGDAQFGWFATPLVSVSAHVQPMQFREESGTSHDIFLGDILLSAYLPAIRVETEIAAGMIQRGADSPTEWTGRGSMGLRVTPRTIVRIRGERAPYLYTVGSLSTPVITNTLGATLDWGTPSGWLAQASAQQARYPDDNVVTSTHAWLLAPVVRNRGGVVQLGYSIAAQDARESRFVVDGSAAPAPRDGDGVAGWYDPYYTPNDLVAHSLLAAVVVRPVTRLALRANGALGIIAHDDFPIYRTFGFPPRPGPPTISIEQRTFRPWSMRGSLDVGLTSQMRLSAEGEYSRTAFYDAASARLAVTYVFTTPALRRLDR